MSRLASIAIGLALLGGLWPADATAQDNVVGTCAYVTTAEGKSYRSCSSSGSMMKVVWDCRQTTPSGGCHFCGVCHTDTAANRAFDLALHRARAFPKFAVTPTAPVPWTSDVTIVPDGGRLCAQDRSGRRIHCYPTGALLLRDRAGTPAFILSDRR